MGTAASRATSEQRRHREVEGIGGRHVPDRREPAHPAQQEWVDGNDLDQGRRAGGCSPTTCAIPSTEQRGRRPRARRAHRWTDEHGGVHDELRVDARGWATICGGEVPVRPDRSSGPGARAAVRDGRGRGTRRPRGARRRPSPRGGRHGIQGPTAASQEPHGFGRTTFVYW